MSIKKSEIKLFRDLKRNIFRKESKLFVAEGEKIILDFLKKTDFKIHSLFSTEKKNYPCDYELITEKELSIVSSQKNPNKSIAIFHIPNYFLNIEDDFTLVLDNINDPGNLGTIIRLCDWYGVKNIICSKNSVDCYNSKVVQSSMGSLGRVKVFYTDLSKYLKNYKGNIYGAFLEGENISNIKVNKGIIVMGNEANGISKEIEKLITKKITINKVNKASPIESLNLSTATGIILNEFLK